MVYEFRSSLVRGLAEKEKEKIMFIFNLKDFALSLQKHLLIQLSLLMYYCPNLLPGWITELVYEFLLQLIYFE